MLLLNKVIDTAKEVQKINSSQDLIAKAKDNREKHTINLEEVGNTGDYTKDFISQELLSIIRTLGFEVVGYRQEDFSKYGPILRDILEVYYCEYGPWSFRVEHRKDIDIEEGTFIVKDLCLRESNKLMSIYLDLGCRKSSNSSLSHFLKILQKDNDIDFINSFYSCILNLEESISIAGVEVIEDTLDFSVCSVKGHLKISESLYIKPILDDYKLRLFVTNSKSWQIRQWTSRDELGNQGYEVNCSDSIDVEVLLATIRKLKEHIEGKVGFLEEGKFYSNSHFLRFLDDFRGKEYFNSYDWNHYLIRIEAYDSWEDKRPAINKMTGVELYSKGKIIFNDTSQWGVGDIAMGAEYEVVYNKKEHPDYCKLQMTHFTSELGRVEVIEVQSIHGGYKEICDYIEKYIIEMSKVFGLYKENK